MNKTLLLTVVCILMAFGLFAQNNVSYKIGPTVTYNAETLEQGLLLCNLDAYRRVGQRVTMNFEDGTKVELFSAKELKDKGFNFNYSAAQEDKVTMLSSTFILTTEGYVVEMVKHVPTLLDQKMEIIENAKKQGKDAR